MQHFSCNVVGSNHNEEIIRSVQVCDGIFDCHNLVDECLCANEFDQETSGISGLCNNICYEKHSNDPSAKFESKTFNRSFNSCSYCPSKTMLCSAEVKHKSVKCVSLDKICDGMSDCGNDEDELFCRVAGNVASNASSYRHVFHCPMPEDPTLLALVRPFSDEIPLTAIRCDGVPECFGLFDECNDVTDDIIDDPCRSRLRKPEYCHHFTREW